MITFGKDVRSESQWNRAFCSALTKCNAEIFACSASMRQTPGWPDRWICHTLFSGWVECKRVTYDLTEAQRLIHQSLNQKRPGSAFVIWLDAGATYPVFLSWYSDFWQSGKWPNLVVENLNDSLSLLKAMSSAQYAERAEGRKRGNIHA